MLKIKNVPLYMTNTYKKQLTTEIISYGSDKEVWVCLADTIFHPRGGGQPFDLGTIEGYKVKEVVEENDEIKHYLENISLLDLEEFLKKTKTVKVAIDIDRRAINAALHTTGHWISEIMEANFPVTTTKGHHYPGEARIEFRIGEGKKLNKSEIEKFLAEQFNKLKQNTTQVEIIYDENKFRSVRVGEYKPRFCGGTHLSDLDQIESFNIRNASIRKDVLRIGYDAKPSIALFMAKVAQEEILEKSSDNSSPIISNLAEESIEKTELKNHTRAMPSLYNSGSLQKNLFFQTMVQPPKEEDETETKKLITEDENGNNHKPHSTIELNKGK